MPRNWWKKPGLEPQKCAQGHTAGRRGQGLDRVSSQLLVTQLGCRRSESANWMVHLQAQACGPRHLGQVTKKPDPPHLDAPACASVSAWAAGRLRLSQPPSPARAGRSAVPPVSPQDPQTARGVAWQPRLFVKGKTLVWSKLFCTEDVELNLRVLGKFFVLFLSPFICLSIQQRKENMHLIIPRDCGPISVAR